ncbi:conserved oligomeric Golgi complex subunit 5 isoform X1 [Brassica rapa]|uniref:conserved oligomeric Golgi complex subunit 5 isoform X1 n=1 Tax=Brassica campestris TaxID=3711 RepID=UPI00142E54D6|nr:conserved oligomeric Golgi complex subunit 5 isoform X1 [Brassica rapa]
MCKEYDLFGIDAVDEEIEFVNEIGERLRSEAMKLAVGQNLFPVEQLGAPYRALRAFRPLIFLETSEMGSSPLIQDLPPSIVLHHLYTRGPDELESPMQKNRLSPKQYSLWLDSQKEDQIWKGVKATLDDYASNWIIFRHKITYKLYTFSSLASQMNKYFYHSFVSRSFLQLK